MTLRRAVIVKSLLAVAVGLSVSVASIQAASADVAGPCSCGGNRTSGPGGFGGVGGGTGGKGGTGGSGGATGGGGTAGSGGATGGGGTAGSGGVGGNGGSTSGTTTTLRNQQGVERGADFAVPCTEYAASPASNPSGEFALGMGAFLLIPLARRRAKKRGK
jgi:hypothetical protein